MPSLPAALPSLPSVDVGSLAGGLGVDTAAIEAAAKAAETAVATGSPSNALAAGSQMASATGNAEL